MAQSFRNQINKNLMNDWRLQGQEKYLMGVKLVWKKYKPSHRGWDHDHCEFCGLKFSLNGGDFDAGYATCDDYHWICKNCYEDFKVLFNWSVEIEPV